MALVIGTIRPTDQSFPRTTTIAATVPLPPLNLSYCSRTTLSES